MAEQHTIHVDIVSAEGEIFSGPAVRVFAPASEGELGIAPRHAPLLTLLKAGEVRVQTPEGEHQSFYVGGGALEVQPNRSPCWRTPLYGRATSMKPRRSPRSSVLKKRCGTNRATSRRPRRSPSCLVPPRC